MGRDRLTRLDWLTRFRGARYARAAAVTLLAVTAVSQAIVQAVTLGGTGPDGGHRGSFPAAVAAEYILPLSLLALLATVPLAVYRPAMAAVAVTFGNAVALVSFGRVTVAGVAAELIAAYWLGLAGGLDGAWAFRGSGGGRGGPGGPGGPGGRGGLGATTGRYLAIGLALPFLVIALAGGGGAAVLLASAVPVAGGAGIAVWSGRLARTRTEAGEALADTLLAHTARGERARIARELHDVVAHHISMIAVLSETGRLTTPGLPEAGARRFTEIGDTARAGLTEMRRLLGVLREDAAAAEPGAPAAGPGTAGGTGAGGQRTMAAGTGAADGALPADGGGLADGGARASRQPQPGLAQLTELIDAAREASGAGTRLIISGRVTPLDPGVELAAYRIVQEALTNTRRHAPGAAVDVELRYSPDALRLRVRDNGPGPVTAADASGTATGSGRPGDAEGLTGDGAAPAGEEPGPGRPGPGRPSGARPGTERPGGGHGLLGMRERAFSVGGALYVGAAPGGGFLVEAVLPSEPDQAKASRAGETTATAEIANAATGPESPAAGTGNAAARTGGTQ